MEVLQEIYFGKVPCLQQIEDLFEKIKIKYQKPTKSDTQTFYKEMSKDPIFNQISDLIIEQFGFNEVLITVHMDKYITASTVSFLSDKEGNAYTDEGVISNQQVKDSLLVTKEGLRFNPKKFKPNMLIIVSTAFLLSETLSSSEIVAALLHEIGHSFTHAVVDNGNVTDRVDEKFADQFVAMYGYGPELNTALTKISKQYQYLNTNNIRKIPVVNIFLGLGQIMQAFISRQVVGDEHPGMRARLVSLVKQLESDMQKTPNMKPKMKKELEDQIKRSKLLIDKYYNDTPYAPDKMMKFYNKNIEPNLGKEKYQDAYAVKYASPDIINSKLTLLYSKQNTGKGYFRKYSKRR